MVPVRFRRTEHILLLVNCTCVFISFRRCVIVLQCYHCFGKNDTPKLSKYEKHINDRFPHLAYRCGNLRSYSVWTFPLRTSSYKAGVCCFIQRVRKVEIRRKKVLTKGGVSGIVIKLSRAVELQRRRDEKSFEKAENKA